jgi:putative transposase
MKKRKYHTAEEKQFILAQGDANGVALTCREHGIANSLYYNWRKILKEHGPEGLAGKRTSQSPEAAELARMQSENALLKRLLAEKEMELSLAKDLIKKKSWTVTK